MEFINVFSTIDCFAFMRWNLKACLRFHNGFMVLHKYVKYIILIKYVRCFTVYTIYILCIWNMQISRKIMCNIIVFPFYLQCIKVQRCFAYLHCALLRLIGIKNNHHTRVPAIEILFECSFFVIDPPHWANEYKTCSGKYQSPIDIEENLVTKVTLPLLRFHNIDTLPARTTITNNGHTGK